MRCYREEIFGPVLVCMAGELTEDLTAAIELVNGNEYGNGVAMFTRSGAAAARFRRDVAVGQVGINLPIPVPLPFFSFTGNKNSVAGGGGSYFYGKHGLHFFTQLKTVTSLWRTEDSDVDGVSASAQDVHDKGTVMPTHA